jgi:2-phospho-L-lactate guanylyltransferase (CobY/MobA/RfbA family)
MSAVINIEDFAVSDAITDAIKLWDALNKALTGAMDGDVTYVYLAGSLIASIAPPEAGERYEHASEVMIAPRQREETAPVVVRASRRRRFRGWSPFEGLF